MSRKAKCRRVCFLPGNRLFSVQNSKDAAVTLTVEEFEAIRLADYEELDQGGAAEKMAVSRGTFQRILYAARSKVAKALVQGRGIEITGGNYTVTGRCCGCDHQRRCKNCDRENLKNEGETENGK